MCDKLDGIYNIYCVDTVHGDGGGGGVISRRRAQVITDKNNTITGAIDCYNVIVISIK